MGAVSRGELSQALSSVCLKSLSLCSILDIDSHFVTIPLKIAIVVALLLLLLCCCLFARRRRGLAAGGPGTAGGAPVMAGGPGYAGGGVGPGAAGGAGPGYYGKTEGAPAGGYVQRPGILGRLFGGGGARGAGATGAGTSTGGYAA